MSNRSGGSRRSGIMAKLGGLASQGILRVDNEAFYQQMLMTHNQPAFTVIESHRSIGSSHMNQDLHSTSKKKDFYTVNTSEFENQK